MTDIIRVAVAAAVVVSIASTAMAQDAKVRANTFGDAPPTAGDYYAPPHGRFSLPPSVIIRNPEAPGLTTEGNHSSDRPLVY
jgi:hypothetical protein